MMTALLVSPVALVYRALGYGALSVAAECGAALAVSCYTAGHTGFWPGFQLAGFAVLAIGAAAVAARSVRR